MAYSAQMTLAYGDLSEQDQAEALRPVALAAAEAFGLDPHRLEVHLHAYNTTYSLQTRDGRRFALRINTSSTSPREEIATQQAWQLAIAKETPVRVPTPVRTLDGRWCAAVPSAALDREVLVTCAGWLEGPDAGELTPEVARALGVTMAQLHAHAEHWEPQGAMPLFNEPLFGAPDRFAAADLPTDHRAVIEDALELTRAAFERVFAGARPIPLHADLHGGNLKWHQGRLAVFDFDDCGLGVPALDLAICTFYQRGLDPAIEGALREGYAEIAPLPDIAPEDFEALIASRQLLLANDIVASTTAQFRELARSYLPTTVARLRHWRETGRFTRVPEGD